MREQYLLELPQGLMIGHAVHVFTHQRWEMDIRYYHMDKQDALPDNMEWVPIEQIDQKPVPKAFQKGIDIFREYYARGDKYE